MLGRRLETCPGAQTSATQYLRESCKQGNNDEINAVCMHCSNTLLAQGRCASSKGERDSMPVATNDVHAMFVLVLTSLHGLACRGTTQDGCSAHALLQGGASKKGPGRRAW